DAMVDLRGVSRGFRRGLVARGVKHNCIAPVLDRRLFRVAGPNWPSEAAAQQVDGSIQLPDWILGHGERRCDGRDGRVGRGGVLGSVEEWGGLMSDRSWSGSRGEAVALGTPASTRRADLSPPVESDGGCNNYGHRATELVSDSVNAEPAT